MYYCIIWYGVVKGEGGGGGTKKGLRLSVFMTTFLYILLQAICQPIHAQFVKPLREMS